MTVAPDGSIYAAGYLGSIGNNDFLTLKITSTGSVVWNRVYNLSASDSAQGVAVDPAGYVYAGGSGGGSGSAQDFVWAKYTSTGGLAGTLRYDTGIEDYVVGLEVGPDGNIVMGGWGSNGNLRAIKFSPNGSIIWNTTYDSGTGDSAYRMALDRDGNVLLSGAQYDLYKSQTVKISASGVVQWARTYSSTPSDQGRGIAADAYGNIYVGGYRGYAWEVGESGFSTTLLKYDSAGTLLWAKSRQEAGDSGGNVVETLAVDAMGNPMFAGPGGNNQRIWRYDPFGTLLNNILYPAGPNSITIHALHPYPDGSFLAGGYCCFKAWVFKDSFPALKSVPGAPGAPFSAVSAAAISASWTANGNSADTAYRLDFSTASDFTGTRYSSTTLGVSATVSGLAPSTLYFARVATTADGVFTTLGSTTTAAAPGSVSTGPFSGVTVSSFTASWGSTFPGGTLYYAQLSTNATFAAPILSSNTFNLSATFSGLTSNTTYYAQVATAPAGPFTALGSTVPLQFVRMELPGTVGYALRIGVGDLDGDGDLDAALAQATTLNETILRNDGGGAFTQVTIAGSGGASNAIAVCDLDSDGDLDLLVGNDSNQDEVVYRNDGALSFSKITLTGTAGNTKAVSCGDHDGDGDLDAVVANDGGQSIVLLRNDGGLSFTQTTLAGTGANNRDLKWLDYDSDGDLDVFIAVSGDEGVLRNDGDAGFVKVSLAGTGGDSVRAALADYDLDGDLDALLTNVSGGRMVLHRADGAGGFAPLPLMSSTATYDVASGDYDVDGDADLLFGETTGDDYLARNDGGGVFTRVELTGSKGNTNSAAWGDFDADGDLDVLLGKALTKNAVLMRNLADTVNAAPAAPGGVALAFADSPSSAALTVTWSAAAYDGGLSTAGLSYALVVATAPMALSGDLLRVVSPSTFVATWNHGTPPGANAQKALYRVWPGDSAAKNGLRLRLDLDGVLRANFKSDATYYFRLQTVDAGLARSTWSSESSAFLLRGAPPASAVATGSSSIAVSYATSGAAGYLLRASTAPDFSGTTLTAQSASSASASVALTGLSPLTTYYLQFGALWQRTTVWNLPTPAAAFTAGGAPGAAAPSFLAVATGSLTAAWTADGNPAGTLYYAQLSTNATFAAPILSSNTFELSAAFSGLTPNTTYYAQVAAAPGGPFTSLGSTVTWMQPPAAVYFDEVSSHSLVAWAYAAEAGALRASQGLTAVNVAKDGLYAGWKQDAWAWLPPMASRRNNGGLAAFDGRLYAFGGHNGTTYVATTESYDPAANAWTARAAMPLTRANFGVLAVGGVIYAIGGANGGAVQPTNWAYDVAANSWTVKAALPTAREYSGTAYLAGRIHVFGGYTGTNYLTTHEAYDPLTDAWTAQAALPVTWGLGASSALDGTAYLAAGSTTSAATTPSSRHDAYGAAGDSWSSKAAVPSPSRYGGRAAAAGGKVYLAGGTDGAAPRSLLEEYAPGADAWATYSVTAPSRTLFGFAVLNGRLYGAGGGDAVAVSSTAWSFDPGRGRHFAGLQPNTHYAFKAKARNLHGLETAETLTVSTYTWAAVPTGAALAALGPSSAAFTWSSGGNPSGTQFQAELSLSTSFASPTLTGWAADLSSAVFGGLSAGTSYYARVQARNAVGVPSGYAAALSTQTPYPAIAGCGLTRDVAKTGAPYATITAALAAVPASLTAETCVVVRDSGTYSEQVVVRGKDPGGFRLRIEAAAGARPVVNPPAGSTAGIRVENSSVTVAGMAVVTTNTVTYGIVVSSPQVTLSSVCVDSGGKISGAGVFLSSGGALSYSSITVQNADGVRVTGSSNAISFTTASVGAFSRGAFYLNGASSTTLVDSHGYGNPGYGAFLYHSHRNTLARNALRKVSVTAGAAGLFLNDASSNLVTGSFISNAGGPGLDLFTAAHYNTIELSTITAAGAVYSGLEVGFGTGNRFSRIYVFSANGSAGAFSSGSSSAAVESSTFTTLYPGAYALALGNQSTVSDCRLDSPNGVALSASNGVTVARTTATSASPSYPALSVLGSSVAIVESSFANSAGDGGKLTRASYAAIIRSTVTGAGGGAGLKLEGSSSNTVTASRLAAPGGVGLSVGSYLEIFDMSTTTGTGNVFSNLEVSGATAAAVSASVNVSLASSSLFGDGSGTGLFLGAENSGTLSLSSLTVRGAARALAFANAVIVATVTGVSIDASAVFSADGSALLAGSRITVRDGTGARGGSLYEDDPLGVVDWVPDAVPFVPPGAPSAPSAAVLGVSSIAWSWAPVAGAEGYRVRGSSDLTQWAAPADTGVVLAGLSPNSTYSIVVAGFAHYLAGPLSLPGTAHTLAAPPTGLAPLFVAASSAALQWGLNGNPVGSFAELQRSTDGTAFAVRAGTLAATAYDAGLLACTSYYYRVRNRNPAGLDTDFAGPLLVRTLASTPAAPGDLSAQSVPGRRIALTWNPSATEGVVAYRLYKDSGAGSVDYSAPYAQFSGATFSTATVALSSGVLHLFGLRAVHRCGVEEPNTHAVASAWALESLDGVRAGIKVPASGKRISGNRVLVMAEMDTGDPRDVSSILFQYRSTGSAAWTDIPAANVNHPNPDREQPFFVHWDVTGLADRAYDLRAVATDVVGASDPAPGSITVLVDAVGFEVRETDLGGGKVKKEQAVSNETANTVATAESGSAVVTKVLLPAGALATAEATLSATANPPALPPPPAAATALGASIEVTLSNGQSLLSGGQTAAIVFNYPDDDGDGVIDGTAIRAENAEIQTFDAAANAWKKEFATVVDKEKRTLTGRTPHFSFFAAFGVQAANLDSIRVYPNPYKPNGGNADEGRPFSRADPLSGVVFDNLPPVVDIKIYTLTGRLVSEFGTSAGTGALQWDGKNDRGEDVASGGYFAVITSPGASTVVKTIGVIR